MARVAESKVTSKGQVTIPEEIRRAMQLHEGDRIEWRAEDDGAVAVRRVGRDFRLLAGMLPAPGRALTTEEMDEGIARHVRGKHGDHRRR